MKKRSKCNQNLNEQRFLIKSASGPLKSKSKVSLSTFKTRHQYIIREKGPLILISGPENPIFSGRFADNKLCGKLLVLYPGLSSLDLVHDHVYCIIPHLQLGLTNRGQRRLNHLRCRNIIISHHCQL